ncbi:MAG: hypothetical protein N2691_04865 [Patescibacteria group bacterium]|nr:hypothetical protein [Patescibacteria group bacterium]
MQSLLRNPRVLLIAGGVLLLLLLLVISILTRVGSGGIAPRSPETGAATGESGSAAPTGFGGENPFDRDPDPATANIDPNIGPQERQQALQSGAFAKVGEEFLYENDLNYELAYYPTLPGQDPEQIVVAKMIEDSIILQGAAADKLITLDTTVFNSPDKDYAKRTQLVAKAREIVETKSVVLEGTVIAIWFHNMQPGPAGYEAGKKLASDEIKRLLAEIRAKRLTLKQAGEQIKNNAALAQVDPNYRGNAIFDFAVRRGGKITYSPDIDAEIFKLTPGQVSGVLTGKDLDPLTGNRIDAVYMIAEVTNRNTSAISNFDSWLDGKKRIYEIARY